MRRWGILLALLTGTAAWPQEPASPKTEAPLRRASGDARPAGGGSPADGWGGAVILEAKDGLRLSGQFYRPASTHAATWILLHGLGANKEEWKTFALELKKKGHGFLALDLRGHGESTQKKSGDSVTYESFPKNGPGSPWHLMIKDVDLAVKHITAHEISTSSIVLAGASLGANIALNYAAENPRIERVILLSPGLRYAGGLETEQAMKTYKGRVAIAVADNDGYAYFSAQKLKKLNPKTTFWVKPGAGHGVGLFDGKWEQRLFDWLNPPQPRKK
ncbi:MAG: alpha/beta fold hydrolase [Elusimicrobia bacterium]|nr:alpha/beta fold hydrolase [Elusimicrobiota bacterium]